ncbi:MAG: hypothetical protein COB41_01470 [Proteobacteria bacterium]|nr:MAG: hypothetical protein COB41_01470 [Pseudomonadota bacterium]
MIGTAVVCASALGFGMSAQASESSKITSTTNVQELSTLNNQETQAISQAAARVLYHTERAKLAIADKKKDEALKQVAQGIKLIKIIHKAVPKYKITTNIKASGLKYKTSEEVAQRYVTVIDNSYVEDVVTPVVQAKKSKSFHHHKAIVNPEEDFSMVRRTTVTLDTFLAGRMLNIAKADIKANKLDDAGKALTVIQTNGVMLDAVSVELPLAEAADNLYLAQAEMSNHHYKNALLTLKKASENLKAYGKISGHTHAKEVGILTHDIDRLTSAIDAHHDKKKLESMMKDASNDMTSWWHEVKSWFK